MLRDSRQSGCVRCGALGLRRGDQVPRDQLLLANKTTELRQFIYEKKAKNVLSRVELTRRGRRRRRRLSIGAKARVLSVTSLKITFAHCSIENTISWAQASKYYIKYS